MFDDIETVWIHIKVLEPEKCQRDAVVNYGDIWFFGAADESVSDSTVAGKFVNGLRPCQNGCVDVYALDVPTRVLLGNGNSASSGTRRTGG